MRIGPYKLANNLLLAPMAGITDLPFRRLCRRLGAGMAVTEMVSSDSTLCGNPKTLRRLRLDGEPEPVSVQILGSDPKKMAQAARINVELGAHIIDINMGCPAKKICKINAGSALLKDEPLVGQILKAVTHAVDVPVTLKIRTGWDADNRNGLSIARIAEQAGIQALAVHGRTRACGFSSEAEYETIRQIKQAISIPVIANGDICTPEKAKQVQEQTSADGLMIGRAAQGRPWIFNEIHHYLQTGEHPAPLHPSQIQAVLLEHLDDLYSFYGAFQGVRIARKHIAWYSKSLPGSANFRHQINNTDTIAQQIALINEFFACSGIKKGIAA
ncbi:tRNA-dihydrouridine synthase DusB [hydrothermal vent metagenome]|uniref:tRNA-dihydrouridine synthase DusB n=1 Tax=hydrothermal vent metagenome TaxID=652676 RepID=A0A3B1BN90_9ZZZZ